MFKELCSPGAAMVETTIRERAAGSIGRRGGHGSRRRLKSGSPVEAVVRVVGLDWPLLT